MCDPRNECVRFFCALAVRLSATSGRPIFTGWNKDHVAGRLELWHLALLAVVGSVANAYQDSAFQAAVPTLVPTDRLDRANGLLQLGPAVGALAGPALAGALVAFAGISGLLVLDLATFGVAGTATLHGWQPGDRVRFDPEELPRPR